MLKAKYLLAWLFLAALSVGTAGAPPDSDSPIAFGTRAVREALAARNLKTAVSVHVGSAGPPESYEITFKDGVVSVRGADANGALYGALELAERIERRGAAALSGPPVTGKPFLRDRGWNLFLTLPWDDAANNTDYDPLALVDPARWWFANDGYWETLLDQMARARLNWLDIHGTWDISVTDAPNLYAYFIQSEQFPNVGVSPDIKAANLARLRKVVAMAHSRGIRVSLMAYEARFRTPHAPAPYPENEDDLYAYTREVVEKMIRQVPELDAIGFRIGESGHGEAFFGCYSEAVKASGRDIPLVTRSWLARKSRVVPLAKASGDFTVEIKYNGEQWGAPYMLMGGRMAGWYSYSFEDYLSESGTAGAKKIWPGNAAPGGGTWPSEPYKLVWQVRANGTHRVLPIYNPDWVRRAVKSMPLGTASGFVVESLDTYYPKTQKYYLANPADAYCDWLHQRDWMYLNLWGRLGYDPATPDAVFDAMIEDKVKQAAPPLIAAWKAASRIISTAYSAFSLGPDHRNHAIELEWGGNTGGYLASEPFDSHVFKSIKEDLADGATGAADGRMTPRDAASLLAADAATAAKAADIPLASAPAAEQKRLNELMVACVQASRLGRYYAERFMSAYRAGQAQAGVAGAAGKAAFHMKEAEKEWTALATNPYYKPFTERLRMRTNTFHWSQELPKVKAESDRLAKIAQPVADPIPVVETRREALPSLALDIRAKTVKLSIPAAGIARAWALVKPLPSSGFFHKVPMARQGAAFALTFTRDRWGHAVAAEIERDGRIRRVPGWEGDAPYLVVPSIAGPTPLLYSSEEALTYLDPAVLSPANHGLLLISTAAGNFHRFNVPTQRKLLDAVERGMTLVVLAQTYATGRYTLDWLPQAPAVANARDTVFDPAGTLGLTPIKDEDIVRQKFVKSAGWDIPGNGAMAIAARGEGRIILVNARLLERLHIPACAEALAKILAGSPTRQPRWGALALGGHTKPVVVMDAGTENAALASSVVIDFMNARGIPFLTLGEVIGRTQGTRAAPIAGRVDDDDLLSSENMNGTQMVNRWLDGMVKTAAALPVPASVDELRQRREKQLAEVKRALGLDPVPPRTPLNAKITGIVQRKGYHIEKLVFESRPNFPVTAHVYVPDGAPGVKRPVIVNPHGHWAWKKQDPVVQSRLIGQVLRGYLAVVVDSPGYSFEGTNRVERRWAGTHDDLRLILGSENATSIYVWDLIRTLDYLATRPDADMTRVGLTGASGGGLATLWAFAVEPRFTAAAPVVFASSMEVNPQNGCLCNHVPGALQAGDRADVLALRAPAPVLVIGAEEDREFPAAGMRLSGEKLQRLWGLFGKSDEAWLRMFPGGHDYNKAMRETVVGFFDKYLRNVGDGSPVPEPALTTEPPDSPELYVLAQPPAETQTLRGIAEAMFAAPGSNGKWEDFVALNGGRPEVVPPAPKKLAAAGDKVRYTFVSERGLTIPALVWPARGQATALAVLVSENGKTRAAEEFRIEQLRNAGITCVAIDPRGVGEMKEMDLRLATYLGRSPAFMMGWDIARAVGAFADGPVKVAVVGRGPTAGQAALVAALFETRVGFVAGLGTLKEFRDAFQDAVPLLSIQPRANYAPALHSLRGLVKGEAVWGFLGETEPDWAAPLVRWAGK